MQVFNVSTGKYLCHNKYYGRGLSPSSFKSAIAQFLNNSDQPDQVTISFNPGYHYGEHKITEIGIHLSYVYLLSGFQIVQ